MTENIFALSTPNIPSALCIFRLSGKDVKDIAENFINCELKIPDKTYYKSVYDPNTKELIDHGIVFYKKAPHSFTGEDMIEFQLHGSRAVIAKMNQILSCYPNLRLAERGEFTRRAYMNGKIDILQAEALSDLIAANTDYQRRMALEGLDGKFSNFIENLRLQIIRLISLTSAMIDFSEDEVPTNVMDEIEDILCKAKNEVRLFLEKASSVAEVKNGLKVAIIGSPNAGKSSFMNAILNRDAVIVSEHAGTTRDSLEFFLDVQGYPIIFIDTAGLRDTDDDIEKMGIKRTFEIAQSSDLIIYLHDPEMQLSQYYSDLPEEKIIFAYTKKDIRILNTISGIKKYFFISAYNHENIKYILEYLSCHFKTYFDNPKRFQLSRERYIAHLLDYFSSLEKSVSFLKQKDFFLFSEELRVALFCIEEITDFIDFEDILENIFSSFCIGK